MTEGAGDSALGMEEDMVDYIGEELP
jgi:hypothetical protein